MADFSLQALHDEIEADPLGLGYKDGAVWKADQVIADLINAKNYTVDRPSVDAGDIRAAVPVDDYDALLADRQEWLRWLTTGAGSVPINAHIKEALTKKTADGGIWAAGTVSAHTNLLALIETTGSGQRCFGVRERPSRRALWAVLPMNSEE